MLTVGLGVPGSLYIPPNQTNWITEGYCAEQCTAEVCFRDYFSKQYMNNLSVQNEHSIQLSFNRRSADANSWQLH